MIAIAPTVLSTPAAFWEAPILVPPGEECVYFSPRPLMAGKLALLQLASAGKRATLVRRPLQGFAVIPESAEVSPVHFVPLHRCARVAQFN